MGIKYSMLCVTAALCLGLGAQSAAGQSVLTNPLGTRSFAMGLSGVADDTDPTNTFYNPGVMGSVDGIAASGNVQPDRFGKSSLLGDDPYNMNFLLAVGDLWPVSPTGELGFGLGLVYTRDYWGKSIATNPEGVQLGEFEDYQWYVSAEAGLKYVSDGKMGASLGGAIKFWRYDQDYDTESADRTNVAEATLYDAGLLCWYEFHNESEYSFKPQVGASYTNFGGELTGMNTEVADDPPTVARLGISFQVTSPKANTMDKPTADWWRAWNLVYNLDYQRRQKQNDVEIKDAISTGAELGLGRIAFFRAGFMRDWAVDQDYVTVGLGAGYDIALVGFRVDWSRLFVWDDSKEGLNYFGAYFRYALSY